MQNVELDPRLVNRLPREVKCIIARYVYTMYNADVWRNTWPFLLEYGLSHFYRTIRIQYPHPNELAPLSNSRNIGHLNGLSYGTQLALTSAATIVEPWTLFESTSRGTMDEVIRALEVKKHGVTVLAIEPFHCLLTTSRLQILLHHVRATLRKFSTTMYWYPDTPSSPRAPRFFDLAPLFDKLTTLHLHGITEEAIEEVATMLCRLTGADSSLRELSLSYTIFWTHKDEEMDALFLGPHNWDFLGQDCRLTSFFLMGFLMDHTHADAFIDQVTACPDLTAVGLRHLVFLATADWDTPEIEDVVCSKLAASSLPSRVRTLHLGLGVDAMYHLVEPIDSDSCVSWPMVETLWLSFPSDNRAPQSKSDLAFMRSFPNVQNLSIGTRAPRAPRLSAGNTDRKGFLDYPAMESTHLVEPALPEFVWQYLMKVLPDLRALSIGISWKNTPRAAFVRKMKKNWLQLDHLHIRSRYAAKPHYTTEEKERQSKTVEPDLAKALGKHRTYMLIAIGIRGFTVYRTQRVSDGVYRFTKPSLKLLEDHPTPQMAIFTMNELAQAQLRNPLPCMF